jgi:cell division septum initiation protein DivIVA
MSDQGSSGHSASEIVSAAERLAEEITRGARAEAEAIRARAGGESNQARAAMRERVGRLGEMAEAMQRQLGEMRSELEALRGSLGADAAVPADASAEAPVSDAPREETARYLREHHSLSDPERLLDEVYAGAGR